jgi:hypothetical protein
VTRPSNARAQARSTSCEHGASDARGRGLRVSEMAGTGLTVESNGKIREFEPEKNSCYGDLRAADGTWHCWFHASACRIGAKLQSPAVLAQK